MNIDKSVVLAQHRLRSALNRDVNSRVLVEVIIPSIKRQIEAATNEHFRAPRWFDEAYKLDGDMYSTLLKNLDGQMVFSPAELLSIPEK